MFPLRLMRLKYALNFGLGNQTSYHKGHELLETSCQQSGDSSPLDPMAEISKMNIVCIFYSIFRRIVQEAFMKKKGGKWP